MKNLAQSYKSMSKVKNIETYSAVKQSVVTIGTFDGVHIGHQKIVNRLIESSQDNDLVSIILTFFPHPRMVLQKDANIKLLNTINERRNILDDLGLDYLLIKTFSLDFSKLTAQRFVKDILVDQLNVKKVIIGYDHRFGKNRNASIEDLKHFGAQYNFDVEEISAQDIDAVSVSSTKIRKALANGNITKANTYLGYHFMITGTVVKGKALGRKINFPTANIQVSEDYKLIPKQGAYVISTIIDGLPVYGMMNIGVNPTVNGSKQTIEVHLFNFNKDIYGTEIQINLIDRIRDECKFSSIASLKEQLFKDKNYALNFLKTYNNE